MKILITGICGFVGSSLAKFWRKTSPDWTISGLDNFIRPGSERNRPALKRLGVKLFHADLCSASDFEMLEGVDFVIDAAANPSVLAGLDGKASSRQIIEHNLSGTINLLEYCKKWRSGLALLSTSRVYSIPPLAGLPVRVEDDAYVPDTRQPFPAGISAAGIAENFSTQPPVSLYGGTKLASEVLALEYGECFDFPVWINRCGVLAGAGQFGRPDQGIFAYWLHAWKQGRPLRYIGFDSQGHQTRDVLHPHDVARLITLQMNFTGRERENSRVINVSGGAGQSMSLRQMSAWCAGRWGWRKVESSPEPRPFDLPWVVLDSSRAHQRWGWKPEITRDAILGEIALQAENEPDWLDLSAP
jgi:CDP-paratose 2-epimerase